MALNTAGIATAIAALSVSGVTIKNITGLPKSFTKGDCPVFFPHPDEWFLGTISEPGRDGQWVGQTNVFDAVRRFRYIYLHGLSIAANPMSTVYSAMAAKVDLLYSAIAGMNTSSGVLTVRSINVSEFGSIVAPAAGISQTRNIFFGCFFEIEILEQSSS